VHNKRPNGEELINNDNVISEKKVLRFNESDETFLGFMVVTMVPHGARRIRIWHLF
jgi:hypothetical protein